MLNYLGERSLRLVITLWLVLSFSFVILRLSGDPALIILSPDAPPEAVEAFRKAWGLDAPLWQQYVGYFLNALQGNFGVSMKDEIPAMQLALERVPATLAITVPALILQLLIGVPAGVYAALHHNSRLDRWLMGASIAGHTCPSFVLALLLVLVFSVSLGWLPTGGYGTWRHALLPVATLAFGGAAVLARFTRSAMVEVLAQPYIRAALAKGLSWRQVVFQHALPNAAIPTVTLVGMMVGGLVAGAVVVESVFSWPGEGRLLVSAVTSRDLSVVQAVLFIVAASMVIANLMVDAVYVILDPRLRTRHHGANE
ncbi:MULTISPECIES: ABC transporter permease [unclassified Bordetella]|uniref:ABC transporter permease n=1 Tax=unclassified Bordetella TaxID=2630031 RepID=UPI0013236204|nr:MULTISPECIES: ABC transporter permease [unclassified Bordetella]MVW71161.1 ABC transporter permease subunit [Bordetella sp. 15P40C-2]MVW80730.1 ABC transporter permease subunit [Bordetella sp. 02P26C-1]